MTSLERIDGFRRLWDVIIGKLETQRNIPNRHIPCPDDAQIYRWQRRFDDSALEYALNRLQVKVRRDEITSPESAGRYVTAVLLAEEKNAGVVR